MQTISNSCFYYFPTFVDIGKGGSEPASGKGLISLGLSRLDLDLYVSEFYSRPAIDVMSGIFDRQKQKPRQEQDSYN